MVAVRLNCPTTYPALRPIIARDLGCPLASILC
jgi:hypothetical protein